jgi:hypothetical protein
MNPASPDAPLPEAPIVYHDRSTGLVVFGILTIGLGCLTVLLIGLLFLGQAVGARTPQGATPFSLILPAVVIYAVLAVALVWLGIGSILARRWARALLLIFSWSWLGVGVLMMLLMAFVMPSAMHAVSATAQAAGRPALPSAAIDFALAIAFLIDGVIFIVLPAIWTFFYASRHVKATCEWRDQQARWTDVCPLPVLAVCLWTLASVPTLLISVVTGHSVAPFFGLLLAGPPAAILYLVFTGLWLLAAGLMYQLDVRGWWLVLLTILLFTVSSLITYSRHDIGELYRLMNFPQAQIDQVQRMGLFAGNRFMWLSVLGCLPFLGYLLFIKRYFQAR